MRQRRAWLLLLWCLTLLVWLPGLGSLPLRDWDESLVAIVSYSTASDGWPSWLAFKWEQPYLNKPPGLHWLVGSMIYLFDDSETIVRFVPCLMASFSVPLLTLLRWDLAAADEVQTGREQYSGILAGLILMTLLPVARHGRLAMLDGALMSANLLIWWGCLSSRHQPSLALTAGFAGSAVLMLKPPVIFGALLIALILSVVDRAPLQRTALLWLGAGLLPGISWHLSHFKARGDDALVMWGSQGLARITSSVDGAAGGWIIPAIELLEGGWPWLALMPAGLIAVWQFKHRTTSWWLIILLLGSSAMVLPLRTQLPWYSQLLWTPIALICTEGLLEVLDDGRHRWVCHLWMLMGVMLIIGSLLGIAVSSIPLSGLKITLLSAGTGLVIGSLMMKSGYRRWRHRGIIVLLAGWSLALLSLWHSGFWLWELNESWDPRSVATQIRQLPAEVDIKLVGAARPSLEWYAGRSLDDNPDGAEQSHNNLYIIAVQEPLGCKPQGEKVVGDWQLWSCPTQ